MVLGLQALGIGIDNSGKTTTIMTIAGAIYGPSSAKRCTHVACRFNLHQQELESYRDGPKFQAPTEIYGIIQKENEKNQTLSGILPEKSFDIHVRTPLIAECHEDVQLQLIDVPGLDPDANIEESRVAAYIKSKWDSVGCVLVVMDVRSTSPNKQVELLTFLRKQNTGKRVPILIIGNKVDSKHDDGIEEAISEMESRIQRVFQLRPDKPQFVQISAKQAAFYSCARGLDPKSFQRNYGEKIDQIGATIGMQSEWKRIEKPHEKLMKVFNKLRGEYDTVMGADESNFQAVLDWIKDTMGGSMIQPTIKRLMRLQLKQVTPDRDDWIEGLLSISKILRQAKISDRKDVEDQLFGILNARVKSGHQAFKSSMKWSQFIVALDDLQTASSKLDLEAPAFNSQVATFRNDIVRRFFTTLIEEFNDFRERERLELCLKSWVADLPGGTSSSTKRSKCKNDTDLTESSETLVDADSSSRPVGNPQRQSAAYTDSTAIAPLRDYKRKRLRVSRSGEASKGLKESEGISDKKASLQKKAKKMKAILDSSDNESESTVSPRRRRNGRLQKQKALSSQKMRGEMDGIQDVVDLTPASPAQPIPRDQTCAKMNGAPHHFLHPSDSPGSEVVSLGATQLKPDTAGPVAGTENLEGVETMQSLSSLGQVSNPAASALPRTINTLHGPDASQLQPKRIVLHWTDLSEHDWRDILYSLDDVPLFSLYLSKEHRFVRQSLDDYRRTWGVSNHQAALGLFDPNTLEPAASSSSIVVCDHPKNPGHWGHILWRCIKDLKEP